MPQSWSSFPWFPNLFRFSGLQSASEFRNWLVPIQNHIWAFTSSFTVHLYAHLFIYIMWISIQHIFNLPSLRWSDGMRCCRSDWPGLCLFNCYQPLCIISQQSWFGVFFFFFHKLFNFTPPPPPDDSVDDIFPSNLGFQRRNMVGWWNQTSILSLKSQ